LENDISVDSSDIDNPSAMEVWISTTFTLNTFSLPLSSLQLLSIEENVKLLSLYIELCWHKFILLSIIIIGHAKYLFGNHIFKCNLT
jgi:hypothetical protein